MESLHPLPLGAFCRFSRDSSLACKGSCKTRSYRVASGRLRPRASASSELTATIPELAGSGTYGQAGLWADTELQRLSSMQKGSPPGHMILTRGEWQWSIKSDNHYQLTGVMRFHNMTNQNEIFITEVEGKGVLLSSQALGEDIRCQVKIIARHPSNSSNKTTSRADGYWRAHITRARESTEIQVVVDIHSSSTTLKQLQSCRVDVDFVTYGPHGRKPLTQHVVLPLQFPPPALESASALQWNEVSPGLSVLPVPTHLLCHLDSPLEVLKRYALPLMQPGDTVAIGESPLAIMQGRFKHPQNMTPGLTAKFCCKPFHPTSSLATACGMQALVDLVGRLRVIFAVIVAAIARLFGRSGVFYKLAGSQARLIDDVTGTLPPYDQFITLGPLHPQETAEALSKKTGVEVAVVDVNDLRKVDILGASSGVDHEKLHAALASNPAGNSDEQTPLVIIRGCRRAPPPPEKSS